MGLDVDLFVGLVKVASPVLDADGYPEGERQLKFWENPDFPGRCEGIDLDSVYQYVESEEVFSGGYGRYNGWREKLAKLAGYTPVSVERYGMVEMRHDEAAWLAGKGPFFELISFSDCEGAIGPVVSAKLAADFAEFQGKADAHPDQEFREVYSNWARAFALCANNGALNFH